MERGEIDGRGVAPGPTFHYLGDRPASHWGHDHTVWGVVADPESLRVAEKIVNLPSHTPGGPNTMRFLKDLCTLTSSKSRATPPPPPRERFLPDVEYVELDDEPKKKLFFCTSFKTARTTCMYCLIHVLSYRSSTSRVNKFVFACVASLEQVSTARQSQVQRCAQTSIGAPRPRCLAAPTYHYSYSWVL